MGEVYRARDTRLDRGVAIKVLPADLIADPERRTRFLREAQVVARLQHPHICTLFDVGVGDVPFLVLELLSGPTLAERLDAGAVTLTEAAAWIAQLGAALEVAHRQGVVHRDLKPSNVMITSDGVKLLDFGVALLRSSVDGGAADDTRTGVPATARGDVIGTPGYMSPEQAAGAPVGAPADIFAFALVCYELLTGHPAFRREHAADSLSALFIGQVTPASSRRAELPTAVDEALAHALERDPTRRPASASAAASALCAALAATVTPSAASLRYEPVTPLIGRDREVEAIVAALHRPGVRLLTLTGAGGTGKTRLAIEVARHVRSRYPGGVQFVDLAPVVDREVLVATLARELDVEGPGAGDLDTAAAAAFARSRRGQTLLVLDNFEQLVDAAPTVAALVAAVPALTVVVTSRSLLRLRGEHEFPVPPLAVPNPATPLALQELATVPAVALFVERARDANAGFALDARNASAVAAICAKLDGLPLALELAAARVRTFTPQTLLSKLDRRLEVLISGARDLPARQRTLRGTVAWSTGLLEEPERRLLRRLAVFVGGCTLEAAEAVGDAAGDLGVAVIDGVSSLSDHSLVNQRAQADGDTRLTMLQTIQEFAAEALAAAGERTASTKAHAAYYVLLAEDAAAAMSGPERDLWLQRLDADHDNLRAAFDWTLAADRLDWALRLGLALFSFWQWRGHINEGRERLRALCARRQGAMSRDWARVLLFQGILATDTGDGEGAIRVFHESLTIAEANGDREARAVALNNIGIDRGMWGDYARAVEYHEKALAAWRELGDLASVARSLVNLATTAVAIGESERSHGLLVEALEIFRSIGDTGSAAFALQGMGDTCARSGRLDAARRYYTEALERALARGDLQAGAGVRIDLASLDRVEGRFGTARAELAQALTELRSLGYRRGLVRAIEELSLVAADEGRVTVALRLAGAADAMRRLVGRATAAEQTRFRPLIDRVRAQHGDAAWKAGAMLDDATLVAEAVTESARP